jgi:hypothetical protein
MKLVTIIAAVVALTASPLSACPITQPFKHLKTSTATVVPKQQTTGISHRWKPTAHLPTSIDRRYGPAEWVDMYYDPEANAK